MQIESRPARQPMHRTVFVAALLATACQQPGPAPEPGLSASEEERIVATVESLTAAFEQAERQRHPERVLALIAPDFYMYADGVRSDYEDVVAGIRDIETFQHFEPGWTNLEVRVLGPDAALATFTFRDSIVTGPGDVLLAGGATTLIWERRDGQWQVVYADADHYPVE